MPTDRCRPEALVARLNTDIDLGRPRSRRPVVSGTGGCGADRGGNQSSVTRRQPPKQRNQAGDATWFGHNVRCLLGQWPIGQ
jgi:hypothetical protein